MLGGRLALDQAANPLICSSIRSRHTLRTMWENIAFRS